MPDHHLSLFLYQGRADRVVDGDTIDMHLDLGFQIQRTVRLRLAGVDTAEIYGVPRESDEAVLGREQAAFVREWLATRSGAASADPWPFIVDTFKDRTGKYGRYVATIEAKTDGAVLNDAITDAYPGAADAQTALAPAQEQDRS